MSLTFANKITICRIFAVPFFISTILYYTPQKDYLRLVALGVFMFAVISDVIDGYVARVHHQKTKAGAILDPLADKLLLISAFVCLYKVSLVHSEFYLPAWLIVAVISRDVILIIGSTVLYIFNNDLEIKPTVWGKATTFLQVITIISTLVKFPVSYILWYTTLIFTIISATDYLRSGIKVLNTTNTK